MLIIHDLTETVELDRNVMRIVQGGVDYLAASKNSGYREIQAVNLTLIKYLWDGTYN